MSSTLLYRWPQSPLDSADGWRVDGETGYRVRSLPETEADLARDSRWPAFFPAPMCLVTTTDGQNTGLEKVVGPSIVNRFPYVVALGFCRRHLSERHHPRSVFCQRLEKGGSAAIQFLEPGPALDKVLEVIGATADEKTGDRIAATGLAVRPASANPAPVLKDAYLVYQCRLVKPGRDFSGDPTFESPWTDIGSHRVYFLEVNAIQLREDIAAARSQIVWHGLPEWNGEVPVVDTKGGPPAIKSGKYVKGYNPRYRFPSPDTVAFEFDEIRDGMALKNLPPLPEDQVEVDDDRARWPCFFPSGVGMISSWSDDHSPTFMPCGSTTIVSRHPLVITPCISYTAINQRYAARRSLEIIRKRGWFGCGVAYMDDALVKAIAYGGNVSFGDDPDKVANAGLKVIGGRPAPVLEALPVHFECRLIGEQRLGTHIMLHGEVTDILVRKEVGPENPLSWRPWARVMPASDAT